MSRLLIPNTTQVPNVLLDTVIPKLLPSSVRILLAIVRKTYGFQKVSDRIGFTQLEALTGLSREGVNTGIKGINLAFPLLLKIIRGAWGKDTSEYSLNLDILTGQLVRKSDQSENLTSQIYGKKVVRISDSPKPIGQNQRRVKAKPPHSNGSSPKAEVAEYVQNDSKEFLRWWGLEFEKRTGEPYSFSYGKETTIVKDLLKTFPLTKLKTLATRFFSSGDSWVQDKGGFTIGVFSSQINKINSTSTRSSAVKDFPI